MSSLPAVMLCPQDKAATATEVSTVDKTEHGTCAECGGEAFASVIAYASPLTLCRACYGHNVIARDRGQS